MRSSTATAANWRARERERVRVEAERRRREREREAEREARAWKPQPGPQTEAFHSHADIIGYGGSAGGGKTDLVLGKAGAQHRRSIIFRRVFPSLRGMIERSRDIYGDPDDGNRYNESLHTWRLAGGRSLEFGACQYEEDRKKHQGIPRDFIAFDEATEFPESVVRFLIGWNRSTYPGQRCQVLLTFNPPMDEAGEWVVRFFAPWLDREHPNPAADGELRWFAMLPDPRRGGTITEQEVPSGDPITQEDGSVVRPKSRTFFHASLKDNPILEETGYGATIDAMPEPLRSLLRGKFDAAKVPDPWQVIPALWVRAAQERWKLRDGPAVRMTCMGMDVAHGGDDQTVLARRYGNYFAGLLAYPGRETPNGASAAALAVKAHEPGADINVDAIGFGAPAHERLAEDYGLPAYAVNVGMRSEYTDRTGKFRMQNVRAEAYWRLREALDPEGGDDLALPPDPELLADLCAPRYQITPSGIKIESKPDMIERLGRSPDKGDAVALAMLDMTPPPPPDKAPRPARDWLAGYRG